MTTHFAGSFYFKQTPAGNLMGEFINNNSAGVYVEAATITTAAKIFEGTYNSVWDDGSLHQGILTISKNKRSKKFKVVWIDKVPGNQNYHGEGILVDGLLSGYYVKS